MATPDHGIMGCHHHMPWLCAQLCQFCCRTLPSWRHGRWTPAGNGMWLPRSSMQKTNWKVLYLSFFYRRGNLALRIGLFYTAASLSGAFGGKRIFLPHDERRTDVEQDYWLEDWLKSVLGEAWRVGVGFWLSKVWWQVFITIGINGLNLQYNKMQTVVCAALSYFGLPNSPETALFLTHEERVFIHEWLLSDNPCSPAG